MGNWLLGYTILIMAIALVGYVINILREKSIAWNLSRPRLVHCPKCYHTYMVERHALNPRCPRCTEAKTKDETKPKNAAS